MGSFLRPIGILALFLLLASPVRAQSRFPVEPRGNSAEPLPNRASTGEALPERALARVGSWRLRHAAPATNVAFAPDGKVLASAGIDGLIVLWETATGRELRRFEDDGRKVEELAFSADGKMVLSGSASGHVEFWDAATGQPELGQQTHRGSTHAIASAPNGKLFATQGKDAVARLWDMEGNRLHVFGAAEDGVSNVAFTPDSKALALVGRDCKPRLMDVATGKVIQTFVGHKGSVNSLDVSRDGKLLVSSGEDRTVRIWSLATGKELHQLSGYESVVSVRFSPNNSVFASAGSDNTVRVWNIETGKEVCRCRGHTAKVTAVAFSPDGKVLASASEDRTVRLWDPATGKELPQSERLGPVESAVLSANGKLLATAHTGGGIRLWDPATGKPLPQSGVASPGPTVALAASFDGKLIAAAKPSGGFAVWEVANGKKRFAADGEGKKGQSYDGRGAVLAFVANGTGQAVIYGVRGAAIGVFDATTGKRLRSLPDLPPADDTAARELDREAPVVAFAPDGETYATREPGDDVILRDAATGEQLRRFSALRFTCLAFAPDGRSLAVVGMFDTIRLWEIATSMERRSWGSLNIDSLVGAFQSAQFYGIRENQLKDWELTNGAANAVAVSANGELLATAGPRGVVRVWHTRRSEMWTLRGHAGQVTGLAFAADGKLLSVSRDGTALIWDTTTLTPDRKGQPNKIDAEAVWASLGDADAGKAHETMARLYQSPSAAVDLLRGRLRPAHDPDAKRIEQLIVRLDDDEFEERERASRELEKLGARAEDALRQTVKAAPSAEVQRRIGDLLKKLGTDGPSADYLRQTRALEVLEGIGTADARRILEDVAKGPSNARLTREAKASLRRLELRTGRP